MATEPYKLILDVDFSIVGAKGVIETTAPLLRELVNHSCPGPGHSHLERRYLTLGRSRRQRLLAVGNTEEGNLIRIKSARRVTRRERRFYEEG